MGRLTIVEAQQKLKRVKELIMQASMHLLRMASDNPMKTAKIKAVSAHLRRALEELEDIVVGDAPGGGK